MDHLSPIGFKIQSEEEFIEIIEAAFDNGKEINAGKQKYIMYSDKSGVEFWLQLNRKGEFIGGNPHFQGKSKRKVVLVSEHTGFGNSMDGAYHCWAEPQIPGQPDSGAYPFIFEVPNYRLYKKLVLPQYIEIQLSGFAQKISYFKDEEAFRKEQTQELKLASKSFIPNGLFTKDEDAMPEATAMFSGIILEVEKRKNELTGQEFYWMLVDTHGGEIDVVANIELLDQTPEVSGIIQGLFWLTGKLLGIPVEKNKEGFFSKYFFKKN